jgi:tRNA A37 threonylcarbamoyladenosine synthetase subunit TsaC/SUA5/YrdC
LCSADEVATTFSSSLRLVLDGGILSGLASTVVDLTGDEPSVLREGALSIAEVKEILLLH